MNTTAIELLPVHGGQLRQIAARFGIPGDNLIDFSANINPAGFPHSVLPAIHKALTNPATLLEYPDLRHTMLKQTLADFVGIEPANVAIANGFVPLLDASLRLFQIRRCLLPVPAFSEYRRSLENAGASVIPYRLSPENAFRYDPELIVKALLDNSCDAILLANPQNPSGALCEAAQMLQLIEMAACHGITILLDEAFIDYSPAQSVVTREVKHANVVIFRSVTKFFAIPGMRVAYGVGTPAIAQALSRIVAPWPVACLASHAVCAALQDVAYVEESRRSNQRRRTSLKQKLAHLDIETYPSQTNFLLMRFPATVDISRLWKRMIVEHQIVLRSCANFENLPSGYLRVAVRSGRENERLIHSLATELARR